MSSFKDFQQDKTINAASSDASRALSKAEDVNIYLKQLENKIDLLSLKCQALWELLKANTTLSEEKLKEQIDEVYLRHGVVNGKIIKKATKCAQCGRPVDKKLNKCLYCGTEVVITDIFL